MADDAARRELDTLVVNTELTLLSITQAIALSFLGESSFEQIRSLDLVWWPYVLSGLLVILVFWSRSLLHVLTIIRWPLEFTHNFLYIAFTLAESLMFRMIGAVAPWYALSLVCALIVWLLFAFDLKMLARLKRDPDAANLAPLLALVERDQRLQLRIAMPAMALLSSLAWGTVVLWPRLFVEGQWHLLLAFAQAAFLLAYLLLGLRQYRRLLPLLHPAR